MTSGPTPPARAHDSHDAAATGTSAGPSAARLVALGTFFGVLLTAVMAWVLAGGPQPPAWDQTLHRVGVDRRTAGLTDFAIALSLTSEYVAYVAAAAGTAWALRPRSWRFGAVAGVLVLAFGQGVRVALAAAIGRGRPPETDWAAHAAGFALPSGHTTTATFAAGLLCLGLARWLSSAWRFVAMAVLAVWVIVDGASRVYLGVHWPTDVVAGWLLGALFTVLAAGLFARLRARHSQQAGLSALPEEPEGTRAEEQRQGGSA